MAAYTLSGDGCEVLERVGLEHKVGVGRISLQGPLPSALSHLVAGAHL